MWLDLKWYEAWMTRSYVEEDINPVSYTHLRAHET